jgi:hypothetical protein
LEKKELVRVAKSTLTVSYNISGFLDLEEGTITKEATKEGEDDKVYPFSEILQQFNGKDVAFILKETSELESVE